MSNSTFLRSRPLPAWRAYHPVSAPHGSMLIDLLIGCVISLLVGVALVSLQQSNYVAQATIQGQNFANASSRRPLEVLGDTLRNAQSVVSGSTARALVAASSSDVTCYTGTNSGGVTQTRIWLDTSAHVLRRTRDSGGSGSTGSLPSAGTTGADGTTGGGTGSGGGSSSTESLVTNVQSLQMTYYVPGGGGYTSSVAGWTTTADPHAPSDAEMPSVGAVNIVATISVGAETRTMQSFVRMRNSPPPPTK